MADDEVLSMRHEVETSLDCVSIDKGKPNKEINELA